MKFATFSHVWAKRDMAPAERFELLMRELELCDDVGFDYAFFVEHHFTPHESWMPAPSLAVAAAAPRTRRIRLGPMGYVGALHQPLRLVEEVAMLDHLTGGRFELGVVPGISPYFFEPFDADFRNRREWTRELIEFAKAAFAADGEFSFEGEHISQDPVQLSFKPHQQPHPPIWWETRDPGTLSYLAGAGINTGYFIIMPRPEVAPRYREYRQQWEAAGHEHEPRMAWWALTYVDETDEKALEKALPHALDAHALFFSIGPGASQERYAKLFQERGEPGAAEVALNMTNPEYLLENDLLLIGSPETIVRKVKAAAEEGFFNTLYCELNFGELAEDDLMRSIQLIGDEVMPPLRDFDVTAAA
ncbi:MAG: LLM class flavin-dependent oxidoreductase [Solirubrobacterales bacterium]